MLAVLCGRLRRASESPSHGPPGLPRLDIMIACVTVKSDRTGRSRAGPAEPPDHLFKGEREEAVRVWSRNAEQ